jgi:hypothetical protein
MASVCFQLVVDRIAIGPKLADSAHSSNGVSGLLTVPKSVLAAN